MKETLRDWKTAWQELNGDRRNDVEVVVDTVQISDIFIYEGTFAEIPENLLDRIVISCAIIVASSIKERINAYRLTIE